MRTTARWVLVLLLASHAVLFAGSRQLPPPESVFGFAPGADNRLATYDQTIEYLRKLEAASDRLRIVEAGKTTGGRTVYFALISDARNLARLDRYREIARRLARPSDLDEKAARALAREGRAFVHIDGGCHATEVAGPQMIPQLAYELLSRPDDPVFRLILENDILMLWPSMNPDGQQMVGEWHAANLGTPYEGASLPGLYQEYVGHDNNRDAYMLNMIESRLVEHVWREWEPHIIYVFHQSSPFPTRIWLPPFSEPVGLNAPALVSREVNMIGMAIAKGLEERGQVGATHMGPWFDAWYPGYVDYAPVFKNIPSFWTETAGQMAAPREYTMEELPEEFRDLRPQSLYSSPWKPGMWRLADAVAYNKTAAIATLEYAARYRESLLYNRYQAGRDQILRGSTNAPYAYFVPNEQRDPVAAVEMLRRLAFGGIGIFQLRSPATADGVTYPAGTWVIPAGQEFGAMVRELLDPRTYPDLRQYPGGPPLRPYDAAAWTLPLQMGVTVGTSSTPLSEEIKAAMKPLAPPPDPKARTRPYNSSESRDLSPFDSVPGVGFDSNPVAAAIVPPEGRLEGTGAGFSVNPAENNAFRAINRAWREGASVHFVPGGGDAGVRYVIHGLDDRTQSELVRSLALRAERTDARGTPLTRPRIGLYQPWGGSMDEGWTRWLLERYGFEFITLRPEDFSKPLGERVDVVILAQDARIPVAVEPGARGATAGGGPGRGGARRPVRPEHAYALTASDLERFETFVREGGTIVCLNTASRFVIEQFRLPVRNVVESLKPEQFFLRGSIVEVRTDPSHQVMAGMPARAPVFVDGSPVFEPLEGFKGQVLARYAEDGSPLLAGFLIGETHVQGRAAALDVEVGRGHVILIGFRPQWRGQPFGSFRVLFNAAIYSPASRRAHSEGGLPAPSVRK